MNKYLQNTLNMKLDTNTPALVDFNSINSVLELKSVNTRRTRGSVRMQLNKVLTPFDIGQKLSKLSSIILPK